MSTVDAVGSARSPCSLAHLDARSAVDDLRSAHVDGAIHRGRAPHADRALRVERDRAGNGVADAGSIELARDRVQTKADRCFRAALLQIETERRGRSRLVDTAIAIRAQHRSPFRRARRRYFARQPCGRHQVATYVSGRYLDRVGPVSIPLRVHREIDRRRDAEVRSRGRARQRAKIDPLGVEGRVHLLRLGDRCSRFEIDGTLADVHVGFRIDVGQMTARLGVSRHVVRQGEIR